MYAGLGHGDADRNVQRVSGEASAGKSQPLSRATDASRFLELYVMPDGRAVRRDQGGDTVSEAQAYALLIALVADDRSLRDHLVVDPSPSPTPRPLASPGIGTEGTSSMRSLPPTPISTLPGRSHAQEVSSTRLRTLESRCRSLAR